MTHSSHSWYRQRLKQIMFYIENKHAANDIIAVRLLPRKWTDPEMLTVLPSRRTSKHLSSRPRKPGEPMLVLD